MKLKRALLLVLSLLLIFSLLATGCGKSSDTTKPEPDPAEDDKDVEGSEGQDDSDIKEKTGSLLPIVDEPVTFTAWNFWSEGSANLGLKDYNDVTAHKELAERTGVHIEWRLPPLGQEMENYNVMISSGDYPDIIIAPFQMYPGGYDRAIDDGVHLDLTDLVQEYIPNYYEFINSDPEIRREVVTDSGRISVIYNLQGVPDEGGGAGPVVRGDWLEELELDIPKTYDDWYEMLVAFRDKKNVEAPMYLFRTGVNTFNIMLSGFNVAKGFMQVDGEVKYGPIEEGYREYVELMHKWYSEGLIDRDFYTRMDGFFPPTELTTTGRTGAWWEFGSMLTLRTIQAEDPNYRLQPVPHPTKNEGDPIHVGNRPFYNRGSATAITTNCEQPEIVAKWINYLFSEEGSLLANYGVEGETFKFNDDGKPEFIIPEGTTPQDFMSQHIMMTEPFIFDTERNYVTLDEAAIEGHKMWSVPDGSYDMPPVTTTSEEETEFAQIMGDIETYVDEMTVKFIIGDEPLENYDAFIERIKSMNIDRAIEIQQGALERYNRR